MEFEINIISTMENCIIAIRVVNDGLDFNLIFSFSFILFLKFLFLLDLVKEYDITSYITPVTGWSHILQSLITKSHDKKKDIESSRKVNII